MVTLIFIIVCLVLSSIIIVRSLFLVRQAEAVIIERFGKFDRVLTPGLHIVVPFIDSPRANAWTYFKEIENKKYYKYIKTTERIDLREAAYEFPKQNVITRDNVTMEISALLYYQIIDPKAAIYAVANLPEALEKLAQTTLRNVIGSMDLDETLVSRDKVNTKLRIILDEAADKWGVKVNRVELQEVNPPADIRHAMEKQMRAERDRRAVILEAEGQKRAAILQAEGEREANILTARGIAESRVINAQSEAEARLKVAEAESRAIEFVKAAMPHNDPAAYLITMQYIKALPQLTEGKDNKLIIVPYEMSSLMGIFASMQQVFKHNNN